MMSSTVKRSVRRELRRSLTRWNYRQQGFSEKEKRQKTLSASMF